MVKSVEGYLFGVSGRRPRALGVFWGRLPFYVVRVGLGHLAVLLLRRSERIRSAYFIMIFIIQLASFRVRSRSYRSPMPQIIVFNDSPLPVQLLDGYCLRPKALLITPGTSKESPSLRLLRQSVKRRCPRVPRYELSAARRL